MGVDLLPVAPASATPPDGRAAAWLASDAGPDVLRARFVDATGRSVDHELTLVVDAAQLVADGRRHLLLMGSREADVVAFAKRLSGEGWRELARSAPAYVPEGGYVVSLVDHPPRT